jgi:hypothetical protein
MMEKSLLPFRLFLWNNLDKLEGNRASCKRREGSPSKEYATDHWRQDVHSDDGSEDAEDEGGILPGGWRYHDSQGVGNSGHKEDEHVADYAQHAVGNRGHDDESSNDGSTEAINEEGNFPGAWPTRDAWKNTANVRYDLMADYARLEIIFPRLTMLIVKKIDHSDVDRPRIQSHVTLFKPITAFRLIFAAVNAVYCRHTTFCGAIFQKAYNPLCCRPVLEEQITQLSIVSKGRIIPTRRPDREDSHRLTGILKRCWDPDFAFEREPRFVLSVFHFKHDVAPAIRSDMLEETLRSLLGVVSACPILLADRLRLEIHGCDGDDLDTLTPLVSHSYWSRSWLTLMS